MNVQILSEAERLAGDKRSSLFGCVASDEERKVFEDCDQVDVVDVNLQKKLN
jgi:hypothetical protein